MYYFLKLLPVVLCMLCACRRSVHRPRKTIIPEINTKWYGQDQKKYTLKNSHLEPNIFKIYNQEYFESHLLPSTVTGRNNPNIIYETQDLISELEEVVLLLCNTTKKIKTLDNFIILKQRDYNYLKHTGLIVLKHKKYPFVIKLFMETPEDFVKPFNRGLEECSFFIMGGGMSRYLAGFTRIPNRNEIHKKINENRYWSKLIDIPRKWFWQPQNNRMIEIIGKNIGCEPQYMCLPSIYALICDAIDSEYDFTLLRKDDREIAISITQHLGIRIDPHINNFMIEKNTRKIIIIDTEHFSTLTGIKEPFKINDFFTYYSRLTFKFLNKKLTFDKKKREELQTKPRPPLYPYTLDI